MKDRTQNNNRLWKQKVRAFRVPGQSEARQAANWYRLRQRLEEGQSKRRAGWRWMAAAAVLILAILTIWHNRSGRELIAPSVQKQDAGGQALQQQPDSVPQQFVIEPKATPVEENPFTHREPLTKMPHPVRQPDSAVLVKAPPMKAANLLNDTAQQDATVLAPAANTPLPRLHINDLKLLEKRENMTVRSLQIMKFLNLFTADMTLDHTPKEKIKPTTPTTSSPNNQN